MRTRKMVSSCRNIQVRFAPSKLQAVEMSTVELAEWNHLQLNYYSSYTISNVRVIHASRWRTNALERGRGLGSAATWSRKPMGSIQFKHVIYLMQAKWNSALFCILYRRPLLRKENQEEKNNKERERERSFAVHEWMNRGYGVGFLHRASSTSSRDVADQYTAQCGVTPLFPRFPFFFSFFWWRKATFIWTNERPAENPKFINSKSSWLLEWIDPADWISVVDVLTWLFCLVSCLSLSVVGAGATFYPFLSFSPHSSSCSLSLFSPRPLAVLRPSPPPSLCCLFSFLWS